MAYKLKASGRYGNGKVYKEVILIKDKKELEKWKTMLQEHDADIKSQFPNSKGFVKIHSISKV